MMTPCTLSVSGLHGRPRKNNHPFGIYENIKLGLINYTLEPLFFELSCTQTDRQTDGQTDTNTDNDEYSIVAVDKPQL